MNKFLMKIARLIRAFFFGIVAGATVGILPFALINHRHPSLIFSELNGQKISFIVVCIVIAVILYIYFDGSSSKKNDSIKYIFSSIGPVIYLSLYTTCAALCQKLNFTVIHLGVSMTNLVSTNGLYGDGDYSFCSSMGLGLVVFAAGCAVFNLAFKQNIHKSWFMSLDRCYLIVLIGISLMFSVWLPLLALPGVLIMIKWRAFPKELLTKT